MNEQTQRFITWVLSKEPTVSTEEMVEFIEEHWGMIPGEPRSKDLPRWVVGDKAFIPKGLGSHNNKTTRPLYEQFEGQEGVVIETHLENEELDDGRYPSVKVRFGEEEIILPEAQKKRYIGISKPDPTAVEGPKVEIIYRKDDTYRPSKERIRVAREYVRAGEERGEKRSYQYYTGPLTGMVKSPNGGVQLYFFCEQREMQTRSINPEMGQLLYIGTLEGETNSRPKGWEEEYLEMLASEELADIDEENKEISK